jgi:hypothetical protein
LPVACMCASLGCLMDPILRLTPVVLLVLSCGGDDEGASRIPRQGETPEPVPSSTGSAIDVEPEAGAGCTPGEPEPCTCPEGAPSQAMCLPSGDVGTCACALPPSSWHLLGCFTREDGYDTCATYCRSRGRECAAESCGPDGALTGSGYTWVSWPAAEAVSCETLTSPRQVSFDACTTPIWLQPNKPRDDVVRCCCS